MKTHRITQVGFVALAVGASALPSTQAATPPAPKVIESQRRMDPTGAGTYHRVGMLRELENTRRNLAKAQKQKASLPAQNVRVAKS
ncbi:MAG TPA: hypothetical protein VGE39_24050 [Prosthecobacter sp.]